MSNRKLHHSCITHKCITIPTWVKFLCLKNVREQAEKQDNLCYNSYCVCPIMWRQEWPCNQRTTVSRITCFLKSVSTHDEKQGFSQSGKEGWEPPFLSKIDLMLSKNHKYALISKPPPSLFFWLRALKTNEITERSWCHLMPNLGGRKYLSAMYSLHT